MRGRGSRSIYQTLSLGLHRTIRQGIGLIVSSRHSRVWRVRRTGYLHRLFIVLFDSPIFSGSLEEIDAGCQLHPAGKE
jgi:hypothetical protein